MDNFGRQALKTPQYARKLLPCQMGRTPSGMAAWPKTPQYARNCERALPAWQSVLPNARLLCGAVPHSDTPLPSTSAHGGAKLLTWLRRALFLMLGTECYPHARTHLRGINLTYCPIIRRASTQLIVRPHALICGTGYVNMLCW
jgi:hypothetical protein